MLSKAILSLSFFFTIASFAYSISIQTQTSDHLRMDLQFADGMLEVEALYTANVLENAPSLLFMLNPGFEIEAVTSPGLDTFELTQKPDRPFPFWKLQFDRDLQAGETVEILFKYRFDLNKLNHLKSNWIELSVDKLWFPNYHDMDHEFTYEVSIMGFPASFELTGHNNAKIKKKDGKVLIVQKEPMPEVLILAGENMRFQQYDDGITFFAHQNTPDSILQSMHQKVSNTIQFLNQTFGQTNPITEFKVVLRNTSRKELGYQFNRKTMIVTGTDFNDYGNLSHEIAHYWWSDADFIQEPWMNESFANYSMFLVLDNFDPESHQKILERYELKAQEAPAVAKAHLFSPKAYDAYYIKGSILLKQLEEKIGKEQMIELLQARVKGEINTTEAFFEALTDLTNEETTVFFRGLLEAE